MKMLDDIDDVLDRVRADPEAHISCRNVRALQTYVFGYEHAMARWGMPSLMQPDRRAMHDWVLEQLVVTAEHASRLNAFSWLTLESWCELRAVDDRAAFDLFFELRARAQLPRHRPELFLPSAPEPPENSLVDVLRRMHRRPGMYFGSERMMLQVWAFCSGYRWAERDVGAAEPTAEALFTFFPRWLEARYPFSRGIPWHRLFHALAIGQGPQALGYFMEHLELYLSGESPDTEDPTMKAILANILAQHAKSKSE